VKRKNIYVGVLSFVVLTNVGALFLVRCAKDKVIDTPLYDSRPSIDGMLIEYPPSRVLYHGKMTKANEEFIIRCLTEMHRQPYHNYEFNENVSFVGGITTSRHEADLDDVNVNKETK
jgi:hypothetical protein